MTRAPHTPSPWIVDSPYHPDEWTVRTSSGRSICDIVGTMPADLANAHLIAAAPLLLEALESLMPEIESEIEQRQTTGDDESWPALDCLAAAARHAMNTAHSLFMFDSGPSSAS